MSDFSDFVIPPTYKKRAVRIPPRLWKAMRGSPDQSQVYALEVMGDCLEPEIEAGDVALICPSSALSDGDFVGIVPTGQSMPSVIKKLVRVPNLPFPPHPEDTVEEHLEFERLNPPEAFYVPASKIAALYKVLGVIKPSDSQKEKPKKKRAAKTTQRG